MNRISMSDVTFSYRNKEIVKALNLALDGHQCTALIGKNGCGKTTIGKLLMGILKPSSGQIFHDTEDIIEMSLSQVASRVGYLFQNPSKQVFAVTVKEDLIFPLKLNHVSEEVIHEKLIDVSQMFHLTEILDSKCHLLSQGEKQRLALASLFMRSPEYIILDEPTTGLDGLRKDILCDLLKDIKSKGIGMLLISHDMKFVDKIADQTIRMEDL